MLLLLLLYDEGDVGDDNMTMMMNFISLHTVKAGAGPPPIFQLFF